VNLLRQLATLYARIARVYVAWFPTLMLLAAIVFIPLGLLGALAAQIDTDSISIDSVGEIAALIGLITALSATSLLGEVFYSGAIAIGLTHARDKHPPTVREIARRINYKRLIVLDIVYVVLVVLGIAALIVPGVLVFVYLGLSGPVVEIEERTIRQAFRRSFELVRGNFWLVFFVLVPIELAGEALGEFLGEAIHEALHGFLGEWLAETVSDSVLSPLFAVAIVLLTLELIHRRDGTAPALKHQPKPVEATVSA